MLASKHTIWKVPHSYYPKKTPTQDEHSALAQMEIEIAQQKGQTSALSLSERGKAKTAKKLKQQNNANNDCQAVALVTEVQDIAKKYIGPDYLMKNGI